MSHRSRPEPVQVAAPDGVLLVMSTVPSPESAESIARALLDERLIACANLLPAGRSIYRWQGEVTAAAETVVLFKTTRNRFAAFEARLRQLHPYELPEIVAVSPDAVWPAYAAWVIAETRRPLAGKAPPAADPLQPSRSQDATSSEK